MYGIYANIWGILMVNVTIYGIHGSYGISNPISNPSQNHKISPSHPPLLSRHLAVTATTVLPVPGRGAATSRPGGAAPRPGGEKWGFHAKNGKNWEIFMDFLGFVHFEPSSSHGFLGFVRFESSCSHGDLYWFMILGFKKWYHLGFEKWLLTIKWYPEKYTF